MLQAELVAHWHAANAFETIKQLMNASIQRSLIIPKSLTTLFFENCILKYLIKHCFK